MCFGLLGLDFGLVAQPPPVVAVLRALWGFIEFIDGDVMVWWWWENE